MHHRGRENSRHVDHEEFIRRKSIWPGRIFILFIAFMVDCHGCGNPVINHADVKSILFDRTLKALRGGVDVLLPLRMVSGSFHRIDHRVIKCADGFIFGFAGFSDLHCFISKRGPSTAAFILAHMVYFDHLQERSLSAALLIRMVCQILI